jgi:hypothetical protein
MPGQPIAWLQLVKPLLELAPTLLLLQGAILKGSHPVV